jgi:hypothetical protein
MEHVVREVKNFICIRKANLKKMRWAGHIERMTQIKVSETFQSINSKVGEKFGKLVLIL